MSAERLGRLAIDMPSVSLNELAGEIDVAPEGCRLFVNRRTGEFYSALDDFDLDLWGEGPETDNGQIDRPQGQKKDAAKLAEVLDSKDWIEFPFRTCIDDYRIMERFIDAQTVGRATDELAAAIRGRGAFKRFKDVARRLNLHDAWFSYRTAALVEACSEWLASNEVSCRPLPRARCISGVQHDWVAIHSAKVGPISRLSTQYRRNL